MYKRQNQFSVLENRLKTFETGNEQKLENMRQTIEKQLAAIQQDNNRKLDEMRQTVDEKLQKTLEDKMTQSFQLVNDCLLYTSCSGERCSARESRCGMGL